MAFEPEATRHGTGSTSGTTGTGTTGTSGPSGTGGTTGAGGTTGSMGAGGREWSEEGRMHETREKARDLMDEARDRTTDAVSRAGSRAKSQLESQKSRAAESLSAVASVLRDSGQQLRQRDEAAIAPVMDRVADGVDRLSSFLNQKNIDEMVYDVQSFARRRPEVFLGAFFTLGVLAARFLKSGHREEGVDRYGYGYVHGTEGARMPEIRDVGPTTGRSGYEQGRGYSQGGPYPETRGGMTGFPPQPSRGYSAGGASGTDLTRSGPSERESSREGGTQGERGIGGEREGSRFER